VKTIDDAPADGGLARSGRQLEPNAHGEKLGFHRKPEVEATTQRRILESARTHAAGILRQHARVLDAEGRCSSGPRSNKLRAVRASRHIDTKVLGMIEARVCSPRGAPPKGVKDGAPRVPTSSSRR